MSRSADRMEAMLRQADARAEKWLRAAKQRGAGLVRQRVEDLQAGLKKLGTGLEKVEKARAVTPSQEPVREPKATASKRRARPTVARRQSGARKRKKAA